MAIAIIPQPKKVELNEGYINYNVPVTEDRDPSMAAEAYHLEIMPEQIKIVAGSNRGLMYAHTTLEQLRVGGDGKYPCMVIDDVPSYEWRSFHLDCARHFFSMDELKKMVRMAALFKLNKLHWHISDDQGWRIESERYPKLHEIGARRKGDHFGNYDSDDWEGGYYTKAQVKDFVAYCDSLGIQVVPEIDMPGHVSAILAAYPELSCHGNPVEVGTRAGIFWDIFCAGKEAVYTFIENMLDEVLELFPGDTFHIGGDEAPKRNWKTCPHCQKKMAEEGFENVAQLQGYMSNRIASYLKSKGRKAIVWNEAARGGNLNPDVMIQLWTQDKDGSVAAHLKKGGTVYLSEMMHSYCDYPYGFISLKSVYETPLTPPSLMGTDAAAIRGTECLAWAEYIRDEKNLESKCWPRYAASAEVGWSGQDRPGYDDFAQRMHVLFPVFESYGIHATSAEGWLPSPEEVQRQLAEFKKNFRPEVMAQMKAAQEEV